MTSDNAIAESIDEAMLGVKPELPNKKQKHRSFMKLAKGIYWMGSPNQEWADIARESYLRITKRAL